VRVLNHTFWLLEQWAHWARIGPGGSHICMLSHPPVSAGFQAMRRRSTPNPQISDDLALARRLGIGHRRAAALVKNGVVWISDFLDDPSR